MSVRKRKWITRKGEAKEAWLVDYADQSGARHIQTFTKKKDADAYHATVKVDVRQGVHTPVNQSITVAQAGKDWIAYVRGEARERSTVRSYQGHLDYHINPGLGGVKLAALTTPRVNRFRDDLLASKKVSRATANKILTSLKSLLRDARRRGNVAQNVALDVKIAATARSKRKLKVGEDIPTTDEIRRIIHAASGKARPFMITAIFTGLRASELRGLRWQDVDLKRGALHVRQRADRFNVIDKPKSQSGDRTVPLPAQVINTLREWKLACPKGDFGLVFPTGAGNIEAHSNNVTRILYPVQVKAGVVDARGEAKYGMQAFRHFYASWLINRKVDGGLELPLKIVQARLGHSSIVITSDVYGHLFPSTDDGKEMAAAADALFAVS
jgi:integrase